MRAIVIQRVRPVWPADRYDQACLSAGQVGRQTAPLIPVVLGKREQTGLTSFCSLSYRAGPVVVAWLHGR